MDAVMVAAGLNTRTGALLAASPRPAPTAASANHIPVYVINLLRDIDRWHRIETSLLALGISPVRIRAIDGTNRRSLISRLIKHDFATKDWALTPGEIGCALSHIRIWKKIARAGLPAIILEDDAEILSSFNHFYSEDLLLFLQRCDIVKFEGLFFKHTSLSGPILCSGPSTKLIASFRPTLGAAGYALTQRGAEALLSRVAKIKLRVPIDHLLIRYDEHGATYGETRPLIVRQANEAFASNIEAERIIEGRRTRKILNSQHVWVRHVQRTFRLIRRGIRRSLAMMRIILVAKYAARYAYASFDRPVTERALGQPEFSDVNSERLLVFDSFKN